MLTLLEAMFDPMLEIANKYTCLALNCNTVILATFLHPVWHMMLFNDCYESHTTRIIKLIQKTFSDQEIHIKSLNPETPLKEALSQGNGSTQCGI